MLIALKRLSKSVLPKLSNAGFSLTFEVEGHWLVSRQVPCETEGRRPETVGGFLELKSPRSAFSSNVGKKCSFCYHSTYLT